MLYPKQYELTIHQKETKFEVLLKLDKNDS